MTALSQSGLYVTAIGTPPSVSLETSCTFINFSGYARDSPFTVMPMTRSVETAYLIRSSLFFGAISDPARTVGPSRERMKSRGFPLPTSDSRGTDRLLRSKPYVVGSRPSPMGFSPRIGPRNAKIVIPSTRISAKRITHPPAANVSCVFFAESL